MGPRPPARARADAGLPPRAPDRRAPRAERRARRGPLGRRPGRDAPGAEVVSPRSCSPAQGVTRLDILNYISHGIAKVPSTARRRRRTATRLRRRGDEDEGGGARRANPLGAYTINLTERAAAGALDPLIGRQTELQRTIEILCRRRKNNPVFVGEPGVGKTALAEGLALRLLEHDVPAPLKARRSSRSTRTALLAGTRFRGDFEERFKAVIGARSRSGRSRSSSSTRSTPPSAPAPPPAARWISRRSSSRSSSPAICA